MLFREQAYYRFIVKGYAFLFTREFSIERGFLVGNIVGLKKIIICSTSLTNHKLLGFPQTSIRFIGRSKQISLTCLIIEAHTYIQSYDSQLSPR